MDEALMNEEQVAERLQVSIRTVQGWRSKGGGPEFIKLGKKTIRYKPEALEKWLESQTAGGGD